jgi:hypothetical protein
MENLSYQELNEIRQNAMIELYEFGRYDTFVKVKEAEAAMLDIEKSTGRWNRRSLYGNYHHPLFKE